MSSFDQLQQAMADTLKVPRARINENTRDADIPAWDSLGHVNLMMALEQTFDIMLEVEDFPTLNSVPAILEYLKKQGID